MKSILLTILFTLTACTTPVQKNTSAPPVESEGVRVASLNYRIEGGKDLHDMINHLEPFFAEASKNQAKYILIPELIVLDLFSTNPGDNEVPHELEKAAKLGEEYLLGLKNLSRKYALSVIGASFIVKEKDHYKNRAVYISPKQEVFFQDKVQPTPWEIRYGFKGAASIKTFKSPDFDFAILICHDAEFPEISTSLIFRRPEVIFVPSQTDDLSGLNRVFYTSGARAIEHMAYVLMTGTSSVPEAPWHSYQGRNVLFKPQNKYFSLGHEQSGLNEELSYYNFNIAKLRTARKDLKQVYPARDFKRLQ